MGVFITHVVKKMIGRRLFSTFEDVSSSASRLTTSRLFIPTRDVPNSKQATTDGHKYLLKAGFLRQSFSGGYYLLPLAQRCIEKLVNLIDKEMQNIGGVKMTAPILSPSKLWKQSGRWDTTGKELFRLSDQTDTEFCLGPTHEESFTELVSHEVTSHKQLPLRLYQLDRKFRDEKRPRFGLLRAREFWMKDMYTFDTCQRAAQETYNIVCSAYDKIFSILGIDAMKVLADPGNIGGSMSHEYHVIAPVGEDELIHCEKCGCGYSSEVLSYKSYSKLPDCPHETEICSISKNKGIEVAHSFYLGTKYSSTFNASFVDENGKHRLCEMGCYGIGVSRLLQAIVEDSLMTHDRMIWPLRIAPFFVCVTPLYHKKDQTGSLLSRAKNVFDKIHTILPGDVILEDRNHLTIGELLNQTDLIGYPVTIVIGSKVPDGFVEVHLQNLGNKTVKVIEEDHLLNYLSDMRF